MTASVLIVDDSVTVRMDLAEAFEDAGLAVEAVGTLAQARAALVGRPLNLLILDMVLPDGEGVELLRELRMDPHRAALPVMMLTTEAEVRDRIRGLEMGASEYVGKPYDVAWVVGRAMELTGALAPPDDVRAGDGEALRILVVDDSASTRAALREALEADGHAVLEAATGEEGLRVASQRRPDAVIVDGVLPGIDGATVIRRIHLDPALWTTPCALLTAHDDERSELLALDAGADAFVRKDEGTQAVLARLSPLLRTARLRSREARPTSVHGPKRVLAVDDSPTYLDEVAARLHTEGYDVALATSGEDALALLAVQPVDCILLDLVMPGLSGRDTCKRIKETPRLRDIPLVMLTALEDREAMVEGINAGADDYITKSADFGVLMARLRAQLRRKQFEDENRRIRERLLRQELDAAEARAAQELAAARASFLEDLERTNAELEATNVELARQRDRAERESRFKSTFLANMSHELRTPLNAIIGFSELLHEGVAGDLAERQRSYVHNVLVSGRHLLNLINDILDLSKIEAGKMDLRREWVALEAVLDAVQPVVAPLAMKAGIALRYEVAEGLPTLHLDPVRIKQVLYNLLSNGIKFTPRGGRVCLGIEASGDGVQVRVADTGIGIRAEDMPRLFREFEQLHEPGMAQEEGTGLGLALTRRLVTMHGGTISVESTVGVGSTFTVVLPREGGSGAPAKGAEGAPALTGGEEKPRPAEGPPPGPDRQALLGRLRWLVSRAERTFRPLGLVCLRVPDGASAVGRWDGLLGREVEGTELLAVPEEGLLVAAALGGDLGALADLEDRLRALATTELGLRPGGSAMGMYPADASSAEALLTRTLARIAEA